MTSGWKCPSCGSCYAPWVARCSVCPVTTTASSTTYYPPPVNPTEFCVHEWTSETTGGAYCRKCFLPRK